MLTDRMVFNPNALYENRNWPTDQAHMFRTMEIDKPTSLSLILTPCDLIVKTKNLPGIAHNQIKKKSTRSKRLKLTI
jgi:hypothetical protein